MASVRVTKGGGLDNGGDSRVGRRQIENMLIGEQMGYGALDLGDGVDGRDPGEACYLKGEECGDQRPRAHFGCTEFVLGQH